MIRPQVLIATNAQMIPIMFIISPAFTWGKIRAKSQHLQVSGIQNRGERKLVLLEKGLQAGLLDPHPWAMLCGHPTPQTEQFHNQ